MRSPASFLSEVVCNQTMERHEKVLGKAAKREKKGERS
jgi:hypothetical protein